MIPGDRLLCAFVDEPKAETFTDWPPHITIVPWFRTETSSDSLATKLTRKLTTVEPFTVAIAGEARFGYHGRKPVNLVATPSPLETIEQTCRDLLHESNAWIVDETTKVRRQYLPHVTVLKTGRVHEGDTFVCDNLYIIEQKGGHKEIVGRINL